MARYEMKYMFDWGSGCCIWSINEAAIHSYGYAVVCEQLPISAELKNTLVQLINLHDEALDWQCPENDLLWDKEQIEDFKAKAIITYRQLCSQLGPEYSIVLMNDCLM